MSVLGNPLLMGGSANLDEKEITENGIFRAEDDRLDGYSVVTVNVNHTPRTWGNTVFDFAEWSEDYPFTVTAARES